MAAEKVMVWCQGPILLRAARELRLWFCFVYSVCCVVLCFISSFVTYLAFPSFFHPLKSTLEGVALTAAAAMGADVDAAGSILLRAAFVSLATNPRLSSSRS